MKFFLIASNETSLQESLSMILKGRSHVFTANSGHETLGLLVSKPIDILFLDTNLPDYKGLALIDKIGTLNLGTSIVVVASPNSKDLIRNEYNQKIQEILYMPFENDYVNFVVNKVLEQNELIKKMRYLEKKVYEPKYLSKLHSVSEIDTPVIFDGEPSFDRASNYRQYALREFFKSLTHISHLERLIDYAIRGVAEIFGINKVSIMLPDELHTKYTIRASIGLDEDVVRSLYFSASSGCPAWFLRFNQILRKQHVAKDVGADDAINILEEMENVQSLVSAPLLSRGRLIGILNLGNKVTGKPYYDDDFELISMLANYMAAAIDNSSLYKEISFQKRYNENILKNITSGVISIDKSGKITVYNKSAETILKIPIEEVFGKPIQKLGSIFADILLKTLEGQDFFHRHEIIYPYTKAPLGISTSQLKEEDGEILGAIMVFSDLTQAKDLEEQLQAVERLHFWSNLSNRLAQEIRNPLVAIKTFAQLLPERYNDEHFRNEFYQIVSSEIDRLNLITQKLIEFAEPRENEFQEWNINEIIDQTISLYENQISAKKARVIKKLSDEQIIAAVDGKHIQEALSNLIANSLDAIPEGGNLKIRTYLQSNETSPLGHGNQNEDYVKIELEDSGSGILDDHLNEIFSPFFTTKVRGMGFGLPIAKRIIQEHKGRIEVNTEIGKGTCFKIYIPLSMKGAA